MNLNFFKGLSLIQSNSFELGIEFLKKSDSIYDSSKTSIPLQPYKRELFEKLLRHYESINNKRKTIEYLNKLISVDSIFKLNYQYFEPEHIKNFETPKLLKEKEMVIASLERKNKKSAVRTYWIAGILIGSLVFMIYYFNRQLVYKKRFQALQFATNRDANQNSESDGPKNEISSEIVEDILKKLHGFEEKRNFLAHDISLHSLARAFHTNSNYLSRVVNLKMEKNFSKYLHDLRIDYAMKELLTQPKFRNYTIKAIAEDCGYTNAESFSRAFYRKNGIYPSYYIKKLNKSIN
jgi:AraC-like DNA-binding protein